MARTILATLGDVAGAVAAEHDRAQGVEEATTAAVESAAAEASSATAAEDAHRNASPAHAASHVSVNASGLLVVTGNNVQAALAELDAELHAGVSGVSSSLACRLFFNRTIHDIFIESTFLPGSVGGGAPVSTTLTSEPLVLQAGEGFYVTLDVPDQAHVHFESVVAVTNLAADQTATVSCLVDGYGPGGRTIGIPGDLYGPGVVTVGDDLSVDGFGLIISASGGVFVIRATVEVQLR